MQACRARYQGKVSTRNVCDDGFDIERRPVSLFDPAWA